MTPKLWRQHKQAVSSSSLWIPTSLPISDTFFRGSTNIAVIGNTPSSPVVPSAESSSSSRSLTHGNGSSWPNTPSGESAPDASWSMHLRRVCRPMSVAAWELSTGKKQSPALLLMTTCRSTPGTRSMRRTISSSTRASTSSRQFETWSACVPTMMIIASGACTWIEDSQKVRASSGGSNASSSSATGGPSRSPSRSQASSLVMTRYIPRFVRNK
mmetsp:Transcript_24486/g.70293  ORF Transcript_24486/g.70293 Transcript_24486/m.70293 type:complete len:214 (+) Transcript_24486:2857-3498(+)